MEQVTSRSRSRILNHAIGYFSNTIKKLGWVEVINYTATDAIGTLDLMFKKGTSQIHLVFDSDFTKYDLDIDSIGTFEDFSGLIPAGIELCDVAIYLQGYIYGIADMCERYFDIIDVDTAEENNHELC